MMKVNSIQRRRVLCVILCVVLIVSLGITSGLLTSLPSVFAFDQITTPHNLMVPPLAFDDEKIVISWEKPDNYANVVDYEVFIDGVSAGLASTNFSENYLYLSTWVDAFYEYNAEDSRYTEKHYAINITSFAATGLTADTEYTFKVRAVYENGITYSGFSEELKASTAPTPTVVDAADYGAKYITSTSATFADYYVASANNNADVISAIAQNTAAVQAAIDATPADGKVVLKGSGDNENPYIYCTGSLFLHSNMTFEIEEGARLLGSPVFDHYPRSLLVYSYSQDIRTYGLINAVTWDSGSLENIRIVGQGSVDGNGWMYSGSGSRTDATGTVYQSTGSESTKYNIDPTDLSLPADPTGNGWKLRSYYGGSSSNVIANGILASDAMSKSTSDTTSNGSTSKYYNTRPNLTVARGVNGLLYEGLTFYNPAFHGIVNYHSENITQIGTIHQTYNANNGDGIEFGDCHGMYLLNNFMDTGDDTINFAAGQGTTERNETDRVASGEGRIFNNYVRNGHGGLIAAGSHVGGFIGDLTAEDNILNGNESGTAGALRIKAGPNTGGGVRNIIFRDNALHYATSGGAIINVETSYSDSNASTAYSPESELPVVFENVNVDNITVTGISTGRLINIPYTTSHDSGTAPKLVVRNFNLSNINLMGTSNTGINIHGLTDSTFTNIKNANSTKTVIIGTNTGGACSNITMTNVDGINDITPVDLNWAEGEELTAAITGTSVALSWPAVDDATSYKVLVKDAYSREFITKATVTETSLDAFYLAENSTYTVAIEAVVSANCGSNSTVKLQKSITTGAKSHAAEDTITLSNSAITMSTGGAGMSWIDLKWTAATDDTYGISYYKIVATDENDKTLIYRCYYDRATRTGYSLGGLNSGVDYTATVYAVNYVGEEKAYTAVAFTTTAATLTDLPEWSQTATVDSVIAGDYLILSWNADEVDTSHADGVTAQFAGYRVLVNGIAVQPESGGLDQVNAVATTKNTYYALPLSMFEKGVSYTISVEAGYEILKIASGSGEDGSTGFNGVNNTTLARNQVTFGKWTGHGPSITVLRLVESNVTAVYSTPAALYTSSTLPTLTATGTEGTIAWDAYTLVAGTNTYSWTFTPADSTNSVEKGEVTFTVTAVALESVSATYTAGETTVYTDTNLETLRDRLVVNGTNNDGTAITDLTYTLSGSLSTAGTATITVNSNGKSTTFNVTVVNVPSAPEPGLSAGAGAGIAIGAILGAEAIGFAVWFFLLRKKPE